MWGMLPTFFCSTDLSRNDVKDNLEDVVTQELDPLGFELVELRRGGTKSRPLVEVRVDRKDGQPVTIEDCARASRAVEARLEASGLVSSEYVLQLSSPGERLLRTSAEWRRFVGQWVNVLSPEHGGRFEGKLTEVEGDAGSEIAVIQPEKGEVRRIPLIAVKEARLAFHW